VTLSHDPKIDDPALLEALGSNPFYIGALGSKRTHAKRVTRLEEAGVPSAQIAKIHSPIGGGHSGAFPKGFRHRVPKRPCGFR